MLNSVNIQGERLVPHLSLYELNGTLRINESPVACLFAYDNCAVLIEKDHGGSRSLAFRIRDDLGFPLSINVCHSGEGCAKVDTENEIVTHDPSPTLCVGRAYRRTTTSSARNT